MAVSWWGQLALVMLGGALGAAGRFALGAWLPRTVGSGFPWGTFAVNLAGSFLVGYVAMLLADRGTGAEYWRAFLIVGCIGGLTTFSALMLECLLMARGQRQDLLVTYLVASLVGGFVLVWLGARVAGFQRGVF